MSNYLSGLLAFILMFLLATPVFAFRLGVDVDNWNGQVFNPEFEKSLRQMQVDFLSWHLSPKEEEDPHLLNEIIEFCRKNHWGYLFNNEIGNYIREFPAFHHADGTYRYDLKPETLNLLEKDPLFLGVVYDEGELMQAMLGEKDASGHAILPYFADTRDMEARDAFDAVASKVRELTAYYGRYGKRLIFETVLPDDASVIARGGATLDPKLLKENYNDLTFDISRGAAIEYHQKELWACIDLWFLDKFPFEGKYDSSFHTPEDLYETLLFAFRKGFDYAYIEQAKGLMDGTYHLTFYGQKVIAFQEWRHHREAGDWKKIPFDIYVRRFPDGYWGQRYSTFIPNHPYGSWRPNAYQEAAGKWLATLSALSHGVIPPEADNWNATAHPYYSKRQYRAEAGLPNMIVVDHYAALPQTTKIPIIDLLSAKTNAHKN